MSLFFNAATDCYAQCKFELSNVGGVQAGTYHAGNRNVSKEPRLLLQTGSFRLHTSHDMTSTSFILLCALRPCSAHLQSLQGFKWDITGNSVSEAKIPVAERDDYNTYGIVTLRDSSTAVRTTKLVFSLEERRFYSSTSVSSCALN